MVKSSAKKKAYLWVPASQAYSQAYLRHIHGQTTNHRSLLTPIDKPPYKRYVDDIYFQTTREEMADQFHHTMNNLHPKMKFEIEKPETTPNGLSLFTTRFQSHHLQRWQKLL